MDSKHFLVATELSSLPFVPDGRLVQLARRLDADVTLLHVVQVLTQLPPSTAGESSGISPEYQAEIVGAEHALRELAQSFPDDIPVGVRVETGPSVSEVIIRCAEEGSFDLISIRTHGGRGASRMLLGSVAKGVLRQAKAPVLCIPPEDAESEARAKSIEHILLTTDLSAEAARPFEDVLEWSVELGCRVTVLYVMQTPLAIPADAPLAPPVPRANIDAEREAARDGLRDQCAPFVKKINPSIEVICHDDPAQGIVEFAAANDADLIALSTHGRSGFRRFALGSVAEQVERRSAIPVLSFHRREQ